MKQKDRQKVVYRRRERVRQRRQACGKATKKPRKARIVKSQSTWGFFLGISTSKRGRLVRFVRFMQSADPVGASCNVITMLWREFMDLARNMKKDRIGIFVVLRQGSRSCR
jgi:hypothetical protein